MPPSSKGKVEITTSASGAERKATGRKVAGHTRGRTITYGKTAVEVFKDKSLHHSLFISQSLLIGVKDATVAKHVKSQHSVVGRLKANVRAWEDMEASDFILVTIRTLRPLSQRYSEITGRHCDTAFSWTRRSD